jgi:hypothetical protein
MELDRKCPLPNKKNLFSAIPEDLGGEMRQSFKDAAKSKAIPPGMKVPTSQGQRTQAWVRKVQSDPEFAKVEFYKNKQGFRQRWEEGKTWT